MSGGCGVVDNLNKMGMRASFVVLVVLALGAQVGLAAAIGSSGVDITADLTVTWPDAVVMDRNFNYIAPQTSTFEYRNRKGEVLQTFESPGDFTPT